METEAKCPVCGILLNFDTAIHHLTVDHQMGLREAVRWAGMHVDVAILGGGDGCGEMGNK